MAIAQEAQWQRLLGLVSDITGAAIGQLKPKLRLREVPGWDSLNALNFVGAVDEEFGVTLTTDDVLETRTLGEMAQLIFERDHHIQGLRPEERGGYG